MTITATVIADSISLQGKRLTTLQLRYPRFIHAELMTHRVFSRNASSSRAIPVHKMIEDLRRDPATPVFWGSNKPGMQAGDELDEFIDVKGIRISPRGLAEAEWLDAMDNAIRSAEEMINLGLHKQIANRILEPWAHINVVVTATEWANFFALRRHADAQPEIKVLADMIWDQMQLSEPRLLGNGHWHLPYVDDNGQSDDRNQAEDYLTNNGVLKWVPTEAQITDVFKKVSVARCARVSYLTHDGRPTTIQEDMKLNERLLGAQPLHASPAEHQATPDEYEARDLMLSRASGRNTPSTNWKDDLCWQPAWDMPQLHGNFVGWKQYRKMLPNEFIPG